MSLHQYLQHVLPSLLLNNIHTSFKKRVNLNVDNRCFLLSLNAQLALWDLLAPLVEYLNILIFENLQW